MLIIFAVLCFPFLNLDKKNNDVSFASICDPPLGSSFNVQTVCGELYVLEHLFDVDIFKLGNVSACLQL